MSISIGNVTPTIQPGSMTLVRAEKFSASKLTYSGVAYFGWPASIVGKTITLTWNMLDAADFAALDALYAADGNVTFDPDNGDAKTYVVKLTGLDGTYFLQRTYRSDVKLELLILAEI